jgi:hypothetical protein
VVIRALTEIGSEILQIDRVLLTTESLRQSRHQGGIAVGRRQRKKEDNMEEDLSETVDGMLTTR